MNSNTFKTLLSSTISISDLTRAGAKKIFDSLNKDESKIILKNNKPVATLVSINRYQELLEREEDLILLQMAVERKDTKHPVISREEFFEENQIDKETLDSLPELEME